LCFAGEVKKQKKPLNCYPLSSTKQKKNGAIFKQIFISEKGKFNSINIYIYIYIIYYLKKFNLIFVVLYFDKKNPKKRLVWGPNQEPDQCEVVIRNSNRQQTPDSY
jgi:hypothetical protein